MVSNSLDSQQETNGTLRPSRVEWTLRPKLAAAVRTGEAAASSIKAASTLAALTLGTMSALQQGTYISQQLQGFVLRCSGDLP